MSSEIQVRKYEFGVTNSEIQVRRYEFGEYKFGACGMYLISAIMATFITKSAAWYDK